MILSGALFISFSPYSFFFFFLKIYVPRSHQANNKLGEIFGQVRDPWLDRDQWIIRFRSTRSFGARNSLQPSHLLHYIVTQFISLCSAGVGEHTTFEGKRGIDNFWPDSLMPAWSAGSAVPPVAWKRCCSPSLPMPRASLIWSKETPPRHFLGTKLGKQSVYQYQHFYFNHQSVDCVWK